MDRLEEAIIKTKEYGRKFGVEYSKRDIKERLISNVLFKEADIDNALENLKFKIYNLKTKFKKDKVKKAKEVVRLIGKYFPDILMITITGSVAAGYPKRKADIDLMIVTKKDRLWITRLLLRIFIFFKNIPHRRYGEKEKGNEFCFNLWLEEDSLLLPNNKQNLQNAMDSILMIPILNKNNIYKRFMKQNKWISNYLANAYAKNY